MNFSIIYWNLWLDNQLNGERKASQLLKTLDGLIEGYKPDCFGINELITRRGSKSMSFVIDYLKQKDYKYSYFVTSGPWMNKWDTGDAIVSRYPLKSTGSIMLGDYYSKNGRESGKKAQAIIAEVILKKDVSVYVIVSHLVSLRIQTLPTHFRHQKSLTSYIANLPGDIRLIAGGDFNEFKLMPFSFAKRNRTYLNTKTGSFPNMTWHKSARKSALLRANPDKLFWSKNKLIQLKEFKVIRNHTSDHKPIYARFSV